MQGQVEGQVAENVGQGKA